MLKCMCLKNTYFYRRNNNIMGWGIYNIFWDYDCKESDYKYFRGRRSNVCFPYCGAAFCCLYNSGSYKIWRGKEQDSSDYIYWNSGCCVLLYKKIIGMDRLIKISAFLDNVNIAMLILVGIIFTVILLFISYIISYSVMRKRSFKTPFLKKNKKYCTN